MRQILVAILLMFCGGCSMLNTGNDGPLFKYGNYCGKDNPMPPDRLRDKPQEHADWLLGHGNTDNPSAPIDDVDAVCQAHDVCYALANGPSPVCDELLSLNIKRVKETLVPLTRKTGIISGRVVEGETGRYVDDCVRRCNDIYVFAKGRVGSSGNTFYIDDFFRMLVAVPVGGVIASCDAVLSGPVSSNEKCVCSDSLSLYYPKTVHEYDQAMDRYDAKNSLMRRLGLGAQ